MQLQQLPSIWCQTFQIQGGAVQDAVNFDNLLDVIVVQHPTNTNDFQWRGTSKSDGS